MNDLKSKQAEPQRRSFFKRSGAIAGGVVTGATLSALTAQTALANDERRHARGRDGRRSDYGDLSPKADRDGNVVLALPADFEYRTFSKTGESFGAGSIVPRNHDGMACFEGAATACGSSATTRCAMPRAISISA